MRTLSIISVMAILSSCSDNLQIDVMENLETELARTKVSAFLSPDQICKGDIVPTSAGKAIKGVRNCNVARTTCKAYGDIDCMMQDASLYGIHGAEVKPENFSKDTAVAGQKGKIGSTRSACTAAGQQDCVLTDDQVAVDTATIAAKVPQGQTVAGVAGSHNPGYPDPSQVLATDTVNGVPGTITTCASAGATNCIANATYKPIPTSELNPSLIRRGATVGGVLGTDDGIYGDCTSDGAANCITTANFVSVRKSAVVAANVRKDVVLGGVTGTLIESPADCSVTSSTGCVATTSFPAVLASALMPANIKNGAKIGGVAGLYPSATHKLTAATATADLTADNFNNRIASASSFEYFTAAGARQQSAGDAKLVAGNLSQAVTIFGVTGGIVPSGVDCSATKGTDCVTTAGFPSYDASLLTAGNIEKNVTINLPGGGSIMGEYPSANHPLAGSSAAIADLNSGTLNSQLANSAKFEYFDSKGERFEYQGTSLLTQGNLATGTTLFGVNGNFAAQPAACSASSHTGCLTTPDFPSYDPAVLSRGVIKKGEKIGLVTGAYPSADFKLPNNDGGVTGLTRTNFVSRIKNTAAFQYWDSTGARHTGQGTNLLTTTHLKSGVNAFGVTGNVAEKSPDCTAANQSGCVATAGFPSYRKTDLTAAVIKKDHLMLGLRGSYPSAANSLAGEATDHPDLTGQTDLNNKIVSNSTFEFWDSEGGHHTAAGSNLLQVANINDGIDIFSVVGNMVGRPSNCTHGNGEVGCVTTSTYRAYDASKLTPGVLATNHSLGGVAGQYPSASFPLTGADGQPDLDKDTFNSQVTKAGTYNFWDSMGNHYVMTIANDVTSADVASGQTIFGVGGSLESAPALCSAGNSTACLTSADFPSHLPADLHPGVIKYGENVGSVQGRYPSSSHPLSGNTNTVDLTGGSAGINRLKNSASFEYWDSAGNHYVGQGTDDLKANNIRQGATIFGVGGAMIDASSSTLQAHEIRHGVTINGVTGTLRANCRNTSRNSEEATAAMVETADDFQGSAFGPTVLPWGNGHACRSDIFVAHNVAHNGACDHIAKDCEFRDTITGLIWRQAKTPATPEKWTVVRNQCPDGWRLPTHKEFITAYTHGIRTILYHTTSGDATEKWPIDKGLWTGTTDSRATGQAITFKLNDAVRGSDSKPDGRRRGICVR